MLSQLLLRQIILLVNLFIMKRKLNTNINFPHDKIKSDLSFPQSGKNFNNFVRSLNNIFGENNSNLLRVETKIRINLVKSLQTLKYF